MKEVMIVVLSIVPFIFLAWFFVFDGDQYIANAILHTKINRANQYYTNLHEECLQRESNGCCLSSVDAMEIGGYELASKTGCVESFIQNMLKCKGSFTWCEPVVQDGLIESEQNE